MGPTVTIKTISSVYSAGYSLSAHYTGLSITSAGEVTNAAGATGKTGTATRNGGAGGAGKRALAMPRGSTLLNHGRILGGAGGTGGAGYGTAAQYHSGPNGGGGGAGGLAATLSGYGSITTYGWLSGGAGGDGGGGGRGGLGGSGGAGGAGGVGGNGLVANLGANLDNLGTLSGGAGGNSGGGSANGAPGGDGGAGGVGVVLKTTRQLTNQGLILGGAGGNGGGEYSQYAGPGGMGGDGGEGVTIALTATITNTGVIEGGAGGIGGPGFGLNGFSGNGGNGGEAIDLAGGGVVSNTGTVRGGAGGDTGQYYQAISGSGGAGGGGVFLGGWGTVTNLGMIAGGAGGKAYMINGGPSGIGIQLKAGGVVVNGSASDTAAVISGYAGIRLYADGLITNFGAIDCLSNDFFGGPAGVQMFDGGTVLNMGTIAAISGGGHYYPAYGIYTYKGDITNGGSDNHAALIVGYVGLRGDGATIDNFATIQGTGGVAVMLTASDRLIAESGSQLIGLATGGGGTLELGAARGMISGLGATAALSGDLTMTCTGFASYALDSGGQWTLTGANNVGQGATLTVDQGATMTVTDLLAGVGGTLDVAGTEVIVAGGGIGVQNWVVTGGTTDFSGIETFTGSFQETGAATLTLSAGSHLWLTGATVLSGLLNGSGTLQVTNASTGGLTIDDTAILQVNHAFSQTGKVTVGGAAGHATVEIIRAAVWSLNGNSIARGSSVRNRIVDVGRVVANGGSSVVDVAISDYGVIEAGGGVLSLSQPIYGTGTLKIDAGATLNVRTVGSLLKATFSGGNATLALNEPRKFGATISGFALTDTIDLIHIKATGASVNAADQLIIVNGATTVATLRLAGNYAGATFVAGSDGAGGTDIALASAASVPPSPHVLIGAMASLGASAASLPAPSRPLDASGPTLLVPRH